MWVCQPTGWQTHTTSNHCEPRSGEHSKIGIGEIGIVGTATAIANAVYHATGIRVRDLPITLDKLLS